MQKTFQLTDIKLFRTQLLRFLRGKSTFALLDSGEFYEGKDLASRPYYHSCDLLAGFDPEMVLKANTGEAFDRLKKEADSKKGWLMGYLGYDLKNELEKLSSALPDGCDLPDMFFFRPSVILQLQGNALQIISSAAPPAEIYSAIRSASKGNHTGRGDELAMRPRMERRDYLETVEKLRQHIIEGDVYELNFCQEFFAENADIDPYTLYKSLSRLSPQPFSAFVRMEDKFIISASMERFLKKEGLKLISQPIKGTVRRGKDKEEDDLLSRQLQEDEKERAENVMIVDLVRNDLVRSCKAGSVKVEELFGIYPFPMVFQMISTVVGELRDEMNGLDALKAAFPMGSMTGAPKLMAMELIERYEKSKRGAYSGAVGYITPEGDFDFNVVIRSFIYNQAKKYLSLHVGSAITYDSVPEKEYEECLVKIKGPLQALRESITQP